MRKFNIPEIILLFAAVFLGFMIFCNSINAEDGYGSIIIWNRCGASFPGGVTSYYVVLERTNQAVTDGYDLYYDHELYECFEGYLPLNVALATSKNEISGQHLIIDNRPVDNSNDIYHIKFWLTKTANNYIHYLKIDMYGGGESPFGDKSVIFESEHLKYGKSVDIKRLYYLSKKRGIANVYLDMNDFSRHATDPLIFSTATIYIGEGSVCDFNKDGKVDFQDFGMMTTSWCAPQGKYLEDINGMFFKPDGYVNHYDFNLFCQEWGRMDWFEQCCAD